MSAAAVAPFPRATMSQRDRRPVDRHEMNLQRSSSRSDRYGNEHQGDRYFVEAPYTGALETPGAMMMPRAPHVSNMPPTVPLFPSFEAPQPRYPPSPFPAPGPFPEQWPSMDPSRARHRLSTSVSSLPPAGSMEYWYHADQTKDRSSPEEYNWMEERVPSKSSLDSVPVDDQKTKAGASGSRHGSKTHSQRRPSNRDEFDGPHQFLERPSQRLPSPQERDMPRLSTHLLVNEQDDVLNKVNDCLSRCAFDFVAKYQFPVPLEADKRPVKTPNDREWTEWVYLLKRLATKRRIPARVLYNGQIKQFVTVLENSLEMRHAAKHQSRPLKDDRNVLQLISAGLQVAKILKDPQAMVFLDQLYGQTEGLIAGRKDQAGYMAQSL